jgi:hypothetical protein
VHPVLDAVRILVVVGGLLVLGAMTRGWQTVSRTQMIQRIGIGVVLLILVASRVQNFGGPVTWQLWAAVVGVGLLAWAEVRRVRGEA